METNAAHEPPEDRHELLGHVLGVVAGMALLVALLALPGILATNAAVSTVEDEFFAVPPLPDETPPLELNSRVHDMDGEVLTELHGPIQRIVAPLDQMPEHTLQAVIATEDADFFEHRGVDHEAIVRATLRNVRAGGIAQGASTITQQYVREALMDDPEDTIARKVQEAVWAVRVEEQLTKEEILQRYMNAVYLGQGVYGFATAARYYFSKDVSELTVAESAMLAGMIRAPERNNPVNNPDAALTRRDIVIGQMAHHGIITEEEAEEARATDLAIDLYEDPDEGEPFWIDWLKRVLYDPRVDLQPGLQEALGETPEERIAAIFEGGLQIQTTLHRNMHRAAHETLSGYLNDPLADPMGAIITVNHTSGAVRAMALGPKEFGPCPEDEPDDECVTTNVNPAVPGVGGSGRQPGSAFKPFVSAAALESGLGTSTEYDTPSGEEIEGCGPPWEPWEPNNYDRGDHGEMEMAEAMRRSINVYFGKLARDVGVPRVVEVTQEHGVVSSPNLAEFGDRMCSIALGAADVFPLEVVAGYGVWANGGTGCDPFVVSEVRDRDGEVIYSHEPTCRQVVSAATASQMQSLLREPVGSGGTAGVVGARVPGAFGKTGTTDSHVDAWFVGSADAFTTAAWIGFETPRPMENVTIGGSFYARVAGGTIPAPMWADYMSQVVTE